MGVRLMNLGPSKTWNGKRQGGGNQRKRRKLARQLNRGCGKGWFDFSRGVWRRDAIPRRLQGR